MLRLLGLSHPSPFLSPVRGSGASYWQLRVNIKVKAKVCVRASMRACVRA